MKKEFVTEDKKRKIRWQKKNKTKKQGSESQSSGVIKTVGDVCWWVSQGVGDGAGQKALVLAHCSIYETNMNMVASPAAYTRSRVNKAWF